MATISITVVDKKVTVNAPDAVLARIKSIAHDGEKLELVLNEPDMYVAREEADNYGWAVRDNTANSLVASHFTKQEASLFLSGLVYAAPGGIELARERFHIVPPE